MFNGKTFFVDSEPVPTKEFFTDACPVGGGGLFKGHWFYVNWATDYPSLENVHINLQETFTALLAIERWKEHLSDRWITVRTDDTTTLSAINKGTSSDLRVMPWLCNLFWLLASYNFRVTAQYISTTSNTMADAISRLHDPAHSELCVTNLLSRSLDLDNIPCVRPHLSRNTFDALPLQVQSMLRSSNLTPS